MIIDPLAPGWEVPWGAMSPTEQLNTIFEQWPLAYWSHEAALHTFALWYHDPAVWLTVLARAQDHHASRTWLITFEQAIKTFAALATPPDPATTSLNITWADTIVPMQVDWLWFPYLPLGHLSLLVGEPGVGKSFFTLLIAAVISRGWHLPDQIGNPRWSVGPPARSLLFSTEDSEQATIKPRLMLCNADTRLIGICQGWHNAATPEGEQELFTFAQLPLLETALQDYRPRLVVLDPVQAYIGARMDMNRANEVRPFLAALKALAARYHCAVLLVQHTNKAGQGAAIHRGLGSIDFPAAARSALFLMAHPLHGDQGLLCHSKSNLGAFGRTIAFTRNGEGFTWGRPSRLDAETLAGNRRGPDPAEFLEASFWLEQRLSGGLQWASKDILDEAQQQGYATKTVYRAKKALRVESGQRDGSWWWRLPDLSMPRPPIAVDALHGHVDSLSHPDSQMAKLAREENEEKTEKKEFLTSLTGFTELTGNTGLTWPSEAIQGEEALSPQSEIEGTKSDGQVSVHTGGCARYRALPRASVSPLRAREGHSEDLDDDDESLEDL